LLYPIYGEEYVVEALIFFHHILIAGHKAFTVTAFEANNVFIIIWENSCLLLKPSLHNLRQSKRGQLVKPQSSNKYRVSIKF
jgi:hypothetical protein